MVAAVGGRFLPAHSRGFALVAFGAALWGTGGVAGAIAAEHSAMSWPAISSLRLFAGGVLMLVLTALTGELRRIQHTGESARQILAAGALTAVFGTGYFQSVSLVGVAVATVVTLGVAPVAVAVGTALHDRRMPAPTTVLALFAALIGLVLVSNPRSVAGGSTDLLLGIGLAVISGLAFAASSVINRRAVAGLTPATLIATSLTVAGLLSAPLGLLTGFHFATMTPPAWAAVAFLVVFQTVIAYLSFYAGLHTGLSSTTAMILLLIEPLTATLLAVVVLHESVTVPVVVGGGLMLTAIVLVRPRSAEPPPPSAGETDRDAAVVDPSETPPEDLGMRRVAIGRPL